MITHESPAPGDGAGLFVLQIDLRSVQDPNLQRKKVSYMKRSLLDQIRDLIAQPSKNALVTEQIKELSVLYVMQVLLDEIKK